MRAVEPAFNPATAQGPIMPGFPFLASRQCDETKRILPQAGDNLLDFVHDFDTLAER